MVPEDVDMRVCAASDIVVVVEGVVIFSRDSSKFSR